MESNRNTTTVERTSDCDVVVTRTVKAPAHIVFEAWTNPELFRRWWVPKSYGLNLVGCDMDIRVGGEYRLTFLHEGSTMEFFGTYTEVTPPSRLVWTNDEGDAGHDEGDPGDVRAALCGPPREGLAADPEQQRADAVSHGDGDAADQALQQRAAR